MSKMEEEYVRNLNPFAFSVCSTNPRRAATVTIICLSYGFRDRESCFPQTISKRLGPDLEGEGCSFLKKKKF